MKKQKNLSVLADKGNEKTRYLPLSCVIFMYVNFYWGIRPDRQSQPEPERRAGERTVKHYRETDPVPLLIP